MRRKRERREWFVVRGSDDCLYMARTCGFCGFRVVQSGISVAPVVCRRPSLHSRVRLVDALIVVVGCHGATARHHHVVRVDFRIEGVAAATDHHIIGILLHFVVRWRLRRWRWRWRGRSVVGHQIPLNLHVAGQDQLRQIGLEFLNAEYCCCRWRVLSSRVELLQFYNRQVDNWLMFFFSWLGVTFFLQNYGNYKRQEKQRKRANAEETRAGTEYYTARSLLE